MLYKKYGRAPLRFASMETLAVMSIVKNEQRVDLSKFDVKLFERVRLRDGVLLLLEFLNKEDTISYPTLAMVLADDVNNPKWKFIGDCGKVSDCLNNLLFKEIIF